VRSSSEWKSTDFQHVDHRRHQAFGQREGAVVLGVAADLQHALAELGKGDRQVGRGRRFADAALAVDGKDLGVSMVMDLGSI
jgi:hypothetical protein